MNRSTYVSLYAYSFGKQVSARGGDWDAAVSDELRRARDGETEWPGFRTVHQAARCAPVKVVTEGSTLIAKARSRGAGIFLADRDYELWLNVDDDVFAPAETIGKVLDVVTATRGVVAAPYLLRDGRGLSFEFRELRPDLVEDVEGHGCYRVAAGIGFGLTAVHRDALEQLAERAPWVERDDRTTSVRFPGLFLEAVRGGQWIGEDVYFAHLCHEAGIPVHVVLEAPCEHVGRWAQLTRDLAVMVTP